MAVVFRIAADTAPEPDSIELLDHKFTIRRVTRSVQKQLETVDKNLRALADDADGDEVVKAMAEGLDALLEPNGQKKAAKTVLLELWKTDVLALDQINELYESVQESATKRPPTSPAAT